MKQSTSWQANSSSTIQELPHFIMHKVHCHIHKSPPIVPILSKISPFIYPNDFKINFNIILPSTPRSSKWSASLRFPNQKVYTLLLPPYMPQVPPITSSFTWLPPHLVMSTDHETPSSAIPSGAQLPSPAPYPRTPPANVSPSTQDRQLNTPVKSSNIKFFLPSVWQPILKIKTVTHV